MKNNDMRASILLSLRSYEVDALDVEISMALRPRKRCGYLSPQMTLHLGP